MNTALPYGPDVHRSLLIAHSSFRRIIGSACLSIVDLFSPPSVERDELKALIALSMVPGVGPGRVRALLAQFGSARAVFNTAERYLANVDGVGTQTAAAIASLDPDAAADGQMERAERVGARAITLRDERYPDLLRQIYDPPPILWVRGDLRPEDARAVAVVGTRRATDYGRRVTHQFAFELARRGFTVVSGLAYGVDAAAHRAAVEAGGRTIAVLGSGVDVVYPARHAPLADRISDGLGAVISELPLGSKPDAHNFPRRNRIIAGLALGTLVTEARASGGALLTAWLATEQNRAVFAVPAPLMANVGEGTNQLIRKGYASLVTGVDELLSEVEPQLDPAVSTHPAGSGRSVAPVLEGVEGRIFEVLTEEPLPLDVLCDRSGLDASSALVYLLGLEFKGLVRQMAGKQFFRA